MTRKEQNIIRAHWSHMKLRFLSDGTVMAQKAPRSPFGLLYTPDMAKRHLESYKKEGSNPG